MRRGYIKQCNDEVHMPNRSPIALLAPFPVLKSTC